jgi:hypothetical protein
MQDKGFLGYFTELGQSTANEQLGRAATNIVSILKAVDSTALLKKAQSEEKELISLRDKYLSGDLGDEMSPDLNYSLKRLVKGLTSENHAAKKGFFLGLVSVLSTFQKKINAMKLLSLMNDESKITKGMK